MEGETLQINSWDTPGVRFTRKPDKKCLFDIFRKNRASCASLYLLDDALIVQNIYICIYKTIFLLSFISKITSYWLMVTGRFKRYCKVSKNEI